MTFFDQLHARTEHLHFEGPNTAGRQIIIDAAEMQPGKFEIMTMYPNGKEIECETVYTLQGAEAVYSRMLQQYTTKPEPEAPKPLTGKYAKLRDDLREALRIGRAAEEADPDDGGTCNFDSAAIHLPRWNARLIEQAAAEAGTHCFDWTLWGSKSWVFSPDTRGQANARSRNAEAMTQYLKSVGYDAIDYCQAD